MKTAENKTFIRWCILGALGGCFMAAGDWLLGCIPLAATDKGACRLYDGKLLFVRPLIPADTSALTGISCRCPE